MNDINKNLSDKNIKLEDKIILLKEKHAQEFQEIKTN